MSPEVPVASSEVQPEVSVPVREKPAKKTVKKPAIKAAAELAKKAKAPQKKAAGAEPEKTAGDRKLTPGLTPEARQSKVFAAMRKLGATDGVESARTADEIAAKASLRRFDVIHVLYHAHDAVTGGLAKIIKHEGSRVLHYYLTAKGAKTTD